MSPEASTASQSLRTPRRWRSSALVRMKSSLEMRSRFEVDEILGVARDELGWGKPSRSAACTFLRLLSSVPVRK